MKYILLSVLALFVLMGAECNPVGPNPDPTPWPVPPEPDAPPVPSPAPVPTPAPTPQPPLPPSAWDACDQADANATARGCPLKGSGSSSWADVCRNAANNAVSMHQKCVATALDCKQIANCLQSTK